MYTLHYAPDNASLIVRCLLAHGGIAHELVLVDRAAREQDSERYRRLNPNGLIPVCVIDSQPVYETAAIVLAIADREGCLMPAVGAPQRALALQWLFYLSNTVHTALRQLFYPEELGGDSAAVRVAVRAASQRALRRSLDVLERGRQGRCLLGDAPMAVDIYLAVCLRWAQLYPQGAPALNDLQPWPGLRALCQAVAALAGVQRACAAEGIAAPLFLRPQPARPPVGSAT